VIFGCSNGLHHTGNRFNPFKVFLLLEAISRTLQAVFLNIALIYSTPQHSTSKKQGANRMAAPLSSL
jgi:hypothetical protein